MTNILKRRMIHCVWIKLLYCWGIGNVIYIKIMTEREKMLAGEIYDCGDEQLIERWHLAKQLQKSILRLTAETEIL